jgi:hypothetical protein
MVKVINLDRIRIENFQIFALADEGRSSPVWTLAVNYTMTDMSDFYAWFNNHRL